MRTAVVDAGWRPSARLETLKRRAALLAEIRQFFAIRGVLEVDTPLLAQSAPSERGLASFEVAGNAGFLVPSPEHALKRLLAAGAGPIYQLGSVFRAGESGRWHNPEFCMLEWYRPQAGFRALMEEVGALVERLTGCGPVATHRYAAVFSQQVGVDPMAADIQTLAACAQRLGVTPEASDEQDRAYWLDLLMSLVVQPALGLDGPVCITHFPSDDAVLVACDPQDTRLALRFECYWHGVELANGAQELTDAAVARARMEHECEARRKAGRSAPPPDEALLAAMQAGLPPCAGVALGVDRLLALMLGYNRLAGVQAFDWTRR